MNDIGSLYRQILSCWNDRDAARYAACFADDAAVIAYVSKVLEVRPLGDDVALLRAVAGMVPPGGDDINPAVNAVQSLVAAKRDSRWQCVLFQNTPAAFHGRPEAAEQLTEELREVLRSSP